MAPDPGPTVKNLIVAGKVGSGKTTLVKEVTLPFRGRVGGFYTEEIREGAERRGFRLKTFSGQEGLLAAKGLKGSAKLGKYGVNLSVLERVGVAALEEALGSPGKLVVMDEIGSMEVLSELFRAKMLECLQSPRHAVLATIRFQSQPFTDQVKRLSDTRMLVLTRENFSQTREDVRLWMRGKLT